MVFVAEALKPAYDYWIEHKWPSKEDISAMISEGWDVDKPSDLTRYTWGAYLLKKAEKDIEGKQRTLVEALRSGTWWFREISESGGHLVKKPLRKRLQEAISKFFWPGWTRAGDEYGHYMFHTKWLDRDWIERPSESLEPSKNMRKCLVQWDGGRVHGFITSNEHRVVSPGLGLLACGDFRRAKSEETDKSHEVMLYLINLMVPSKKLHWAKPLENMKVTEE